MQILRKRTELIDFLKNIKAQKTLGFVPTMGAIHQGHASLVKASKKNCDITIVSVFINPKQFNDKADFEAYPKTEETDVFQLENAGCDVVFFPEYEEVFVGKSIKTYLNDIDNIWEGLSRPDHFSGVVEVLYHFFDLIKPDKVFFGQKDFQQTVIVKKLIEQNFKNIELHIEKTHRENDGLAMSSRNIRLSEEDRKKAPVIFKTLQYVKDNLYNFSVAELEQKAIEKINETGLKVDYFVLVNANNLAKINTINENEKVVAITAVYAGKTRLLDNEIVN